MTTPLLVDHGCPVRQHMTIDFQKSKKDTNHFCPEDYCFYFDRGWFWYQWRSIEKLYAFFFSSARFSLTLVWQNNILRIKHPVSLDSWHTVCSNVYLLFYYNHSLWSSLCFGWRSHPEECALCWKKQLDVHRWRSKCQQCADVYSKRNLWLQP